MPSTFETAGQRSPDPESVAAGLTKAQREALVRAELDGNLDRYFARFISQAAGRGLVRKKLGTAVWSGVMLSSLGEQVRAALQAKETK